MNLSFEFFPPKDLDFLKVAACVNDLKILDPRFISITYGALGNSQEKSIGLINAIKSFSDIEIASHLTLVNKSIDQINMIANQLKSLGIKKIVAIRGDSPEGKFCQHPEGFHATSDFVAFLKDSGFEIFVSAYPEPHPESEGFEFDLALLEKKVAAGATKAITQFSFVDSQFEILKNEVSRRNINVELIAGIMPIYNIESLCNMAARCGARIPETIIKKFTGTPNDEEIAIEVISNQISKLCDMGYESFHVYTLNRSELIKRIMERIS
ncbi:MAG: methylenetetrahydrofolate reductase [Gammaproteobacteria bacterium]